MFKKSVSQIKKALPVLLAVFFVVSLTAVSASAHYGHGFRYGWGYNYPFGLYPPIESVGIASPVGITEAAVPAMTTIAVPAATTATVAASPIIVASEPGILGAPIVTGLGYGPGYYPWGYGGWGHGHYGGCHHR
jgi:hypothetical protein